MDLVEKMLLCCIGLEIVNAVLMHPNIRIKLVNKRDLKNNTNEIIDALKGEYIEFMNKNI